MRATAWAVLLWAAVAHADVVDVSVRAGVPGGAPPALLVRVLAPLRGFRVQLQRSDGERLEVKEKAGVGQERAVALPQPDGRFHWDGTLTVTLKDGTEEGLPLSFDTELWGPPSLALDKERDVDLQKRTLRFQLNRPAVRASVDVYDEEGVLAWAGEFPYEGAAAGAPLQASWGEVKGEVLRISLKAFTGSGAYASVDLFPYAVHVPHDEVVFDTGKAGIRADQLPRLTAPLQELQRRIARARRWADVRLYVAGHTDRVGDPASNRALSLARARAIGQHFRRQGVAVPVLVEGFGEDQPRVQTPDETPEERNRRADYILSVGPPSTAAWKPL
ncbi:MAG: OmpA family protein [Deltaproteobacteria bacterium]|nr:OmpA family protein [Deltaproteobacteria bacterium]